MRKTISVLLLLCFLSVPSFAAEGVSVSAKAAVLYDPLCDAVLFGKNEHMLLGMASTTKIMTAVAALELYDPKEQVVIQPEWCNIEGSSMYLQEGERLSVLDLLYGLLLASGNDAATALAGIYTGQQTDFVAYMNEKAAELRLENTNFSNPSGLSEEGHYTTAVDLARLTAYAMKQPLFAEIVRTQTYVCNGRLLQNHNKLLERINACGVKTGYTKSDGRCLVSAMERDGRMLIAVTLNAPDDWSDHALLYQAGFSALAPITPIEAGTVFHIPVIGGKESAVPVYCINTCTLSMDECLQNNVRVHILGPRFVYAEEAKGGKSYGYAEVRYGDTVLFQTELYYANTVDPMDVKITLWQRFLNWLCCLLE